MSIAYLFALLTGFVFAGFVSSVWPLLGGRDVSFSLLRQTSFLAPFEVLVVVFCIPVLLLKLGVGQISSGHSMLIGFSAIGGAIMCSFFQGVVVISGAYLIG